MSFSLYTWCHAVSPCHGAGETLGDKMLAGRRPNLHIACVRMSVYMYVLAVPV